jgi:hypothetical protein
MKKPFDLSEMRKKPAMPAQRKAVKPAAKPGTPMPGMKKLTQTPKRATPALAGAAAKKEALKRFRPNK